MVNSRRKRKETPICAYIIQKPMVEYKEKTKHLGEVPYKLSSGCDGDIVSHEIGRPTERRHHQDVLRLVRYKERGGGKRGQK